MPYTQLDIMTLKERRKLSKVTMRELYETAGLTLTRYASIEGGHELPTKKEWEAIDTAFYLIERRRAVDDGDDGLLTCSVCADRYTTSPSGVCDHCRHQQWLDDNA